jgi:hypothetical protein
MPFPAPVGEKSGVCDSEAMVCDSGGGGEKGKWRKGAEDRMTVLSPPAGSFLYSGKFLAIFNYLQPFLQTQFSIFV